MRRFLQRMRADRRGLAFIEFALVAPFILLIIFGGIELTRFMVIVQKVDKTAYAIADLTAQYQPATADRAGGEINADEMNNVVFRQFAALMAPYDAPTNGSIIVSSIRRERDTIRIKWQIASPGYSDAQTTSAVSGLTPASVNSAGAGLRDRAATFTGDTALEMANMLGYENMVVSEVFFRYRPILSYVLRGEYFPFTLGETTLVRRIYSRPRNGNLICLPPNFLYDECVNRNQVLGLCTTVTGTGSCTDECGDCRANTREWCSVAATPALWRCSNGTRTNQNLPTGCTGVGTISCPEEQAMRVIRTMKGDARGSVLMLTGLAILILFAVAGAGVDFGRQQLVRMKLQNASDAAAIAAASMPESTTVDQRRQVALRYYNLNYPASYLGVARPSPNIQIGEQIVVDASTSMPTNFISNVGVQQLESQGRTVVNRTNQQAAIYDVILAMDNSGSMAWPTTAPTFTSAANADNARNLGILRCQTDMRPIIRDNWCYYFPYPSTNPLKGPEGIPMGDGSRRSYPSLANPSLTTCQNNAWLNYCALVGYGTNVANGTPFFNHGFGVTSNTRLNALRTVALNFTTRIIEEGTPGSRIGTVTWADAVIGSQALTDSASIIRGRIHDMNAWAGTNPYLAMVQVNNLAGAFNPRHVKAVVLLSDGMPTQIGPISTTGANAGRDSGNCDGNNYCAPSANNAQTICTQLKNSGVQLYTVGFISPTDPDLNATQRAQAQTFLRSCASVDNEGNPLYYNAQNGEELLQAFEQILSSLGRIRISQ